MTVTADQVRMFLLGAKWAAARTRNSLDDKVVALAALLAANDALMQPLLDYLNSKLAPIFAGTEDGPEFPPLLLAYRAEVEDMAHELAA